MNVPRLSVERCALAQAVAFFKSRGYKVEDVSRRRGHNGYDLLATRRRENLKIEVKRCSRAWQIPDLFNTEFDANNQLVADVLCVVYFAPGLKNTVCLIPREAIPPEMVVTKVVYRIRSSFKRQDVLQQFAHRFPASAG